MRLDHDMPNDGFQLRIERKYADVDRLAGLVHRLVGLEEQYGPRLDLKLLAGAEPGSFNRQLVNAVLEGRDLDVQAALALDQA